MNFYRVLGACGGEDQTAKGDSNRNCERDLPLGLGQTFNHARSISPFGRCHAAFFQRSTDSGERATELAHKLQHLSPLRVPATPAFRQVIRHNWGHQSMPSQQSVTACHGAEKRDHRKPQKPAMNDLHAIEVGGGLR